MLAKYKINDIYILKKDLPNLSVGAEFLIKDCLNSNELFIMAINKESFKISDIENFDEWFEKKDSRWMPELKNNYFYIDFINVVLRQDFSVHERININHDIDRFNFKLGNVFETKNDAMFFIDEFLKKSFDKYHEQYPPNSPRG